MKNDSSMDLSRRERQIMDIVYRRGRATAAQVRGELPDAPSYSAVRTLLRILEGKGHLSHTNEGTRYVYLPTHPRKSAGRAALKRVLRTFYHGSVESAVAALLHVSEAGLSKEELRRLSQLIDKARREGR